MKLTPEEKTARKEARREEDHIQLCRDLYIYWDEFYSNLNLREMPEFKEYESKMSRYFGSFDKEEKVFKASFSFYRQAQILFEKMKCAAIVKKFSSTHSWAPFQSENFKCKDCGYCATSRAWKEYDADLFERTSVPHYDYEGNMIHYTCKELQSRYAERKEKKYRRCKQCGVWGCPFWWSPSGMRGNYKV